MQFSVNTLTERTGTLQSTLKVTARGKTQTKKTDGKGSVFNILCRPTEEVFY